MVLVVEIERRKEKDLRLRHWWRRWWWWWWWFGYMRASKDNGTRKGFGNWKSVRL